MTPFPLRRARACAVNARSCASCSVSDCRKVKPHCRIELISEKSAYGVWRETWRTIGYWASLYRCGMELRRMEDGAVTETSLPARRGVYVDSRGSALGRTGMISGLEPK